MEGERRKGEINFLEGKFRSFSLATGCQMLVNTPGKCAVGPIAFLYCNNR